MAQWEDSPELRVPWSLEYSIMGEDMLGGYRSQTLQGASLSGTYWLLGQAHTFGGPF